MITITARATRGARVYGNLNAEQLLCCPLHQENMRPHLCDVPLKRRDVDCLDRHERSVLKDFASEKELLLL